MIKYTPVFPSSVIEKRKPSDMNFNTKISNDFGLHLGVVLEVIEIDDERNQSKAVEEYRVMTIGQDKKRGKNTSIYKNCIPMDRFGGLADFMQLRYRTPEKSKETEKSASLRNQSGSIVLVLALDGNSEQGIIVGSIAHPDKKSVLNKELGHHLESEFNGMNFQINKDGEFTITFNSPSNIKDNKVEYADEEAGGTYMKMEKDGSVEVNDGNTERIRIDKTNKSLHLESEELTELKTGQINVTATKGVNAKATEDVILEAEGSAALKFIKEFKLETSDKASVKAKDIKVESDTKIDQKCKEYKVKGSNKVEVKGKEIFLTPDTMVHVGGPGGTPAVIQTTQAQGVGNLGFPVVVSFIGPYSTKVNVAS